MRDRNRPGRDSFNRRSESRRPDFSKRQNANWQEKFKITCDNCGKESSVPFKPSNDKPVYCEDCFREKNNKSDDRPRRPREANYSRDRQESSNIDKEIKQLNEKLDAITALLEDLKKLNTKPAKKIGIKQPIKKSEPNFD